MSCHPKVLAQSGHFQIERCPHCSGISLHLGPTTIRMDGRSLETLREMMNQALEQMDSDRAVEAARHVTLRRAGTN